MNKKLFEELTRLLAYSGRKIKEAHITADGATAIVADESGEEFRLYVAEVVKEKPRLELAYVD